LFAIALAIAAQGCVARPRFTALGDDFALAPGEAAVLRGPPDYVVRFVAVVSDGRCPRSTECAATLPVTVSVSLGTGGGETRQELSILDRDVGEPRFKGIRSCAPLGPYVLRLRDVQPWPPTRWGIPSSLYRATFVVGASCGVAAATR